MTGQRPGSSDVAGSSSLPPECYSLAMTLANSSCIPSVFVDSILPEGTMGMVREVIAAQQACSAAQAQTQAAVASCVTNITVGYGVGQSCPSECVSAMSVMETQIRT